MSGERDKVSGTVKEKLGSATGDEQLEGEGKTQKNAGKVAGALDSAKEKAKGAADAVKDTVSRDHKD